MAVAKLLLLILGGVAQLHGQTPPNVRPPTEHLREQRGIERGLPFIRRWFTSGCFSRPPSSSHSRTLPHPHSPTLSRTSSSHPKLLPQAATLTTPTPAFTIGVLLCVFGGLLRAYCYRALGAHFTFELSIRPTQVLVTHGVYGVIRHPSYTGAFGLGLGWLLCLFDRRGVVMSLVTSAVASGGDSDIDQAVVTAALTCVWATTVCMLCPRVDQADEQGGHDAGKELWRGVAGVGKEGALSVGSWCVLIPKRRTG
ncbi:hypothetical protein JVT61DRAFT_14510 [Boletus reticuloceps]|uniref:Protein-S-isoprenylcysteine O-methyltransferase n=1 Tax=Boletus reticuloceps TaxID=495285 RepID=A0A8I3AA98_9AGAM|nr:hypothetical protein JVT61DRAFT_14510 [Boletus reticuloceps]